MPCKITPNAHPIFFFFGALLGINTFAQTPDPGVPGPLAVARDLYNLGDAVFRPTGFPRSVEVKGVVHSPVELNKGPFPVVLILHGRHDACYNPNTNQPYSRWPCDNAKDEIPSYEGYDYFASALASHGFIVISIGANAIAISDNSTGEYGMNARAQLLQHHLTLWKGYHEQGGSPFGNKFVGALDMQKIGTMGHSRGGEGVITHAIYNQKLGSPFAIKAVLPLAATNYNRPVLNRVAIAPLLAYCDGDEPHLGGLHYFDDSRYLDSNDQTPKHYIVIMGANHNYYNTKWTPGLFPAGTMDDWDLMDNPATDSYCGLNVSGNKRLTPAKQRSTLIAYGSAFFRVYLKRENQFAPILEVEDRQPPVSSTLKLDEVYVSYHAPTAKRMDINRTNHKNTETTNTVLGAASQNGLANYKICGDVIARHFCLGLAEIQEPHGHYLGNTELLGLSQLQITWDGNTDAYSNQIPAGKGNFTTYTSLQFRASLNFKDSPQNQSLDFSVQLKDASGKTHLEKVSENTNAFFFPPGNLQNINPRLVQHTIRLPLSHYQSLDLSKIESIQFQFTGNSKGAILISDLALSSPTNNVVTGIHNIGPNMSKMARFSLSPNPTANYLNIIGMGTAVPYEIFDVNGTLKLLGTESQINVSHFANGLYFLKIRNKLTKFQILK